MNLLGRIRLAITISSSFDFTLRGLHFLILPLQDLHFLSIFAQV